MNDKERKGTRQNITLENQGKSSPPNNGETQINQDQGRGRNGITSGRGRTVNQGRERRKSHSLRQEVRTKSNINQQKTSKATSNSNI